MLNMKLVEKMGVCKDARKDLEMLHECMSAMVDTHNRRHYSLAYSKREVKKLRKTVRRMEKLMQRLWGFPEDREMHYHWARFDALSEDVTNT